MIRIENASKKLANELSLSLVHQTHSSEVINTLGTTIDKFTLHLEDMAKIIHEKADLLFRDLIEPIDLYYKHYNQTSSVILREC